MFKYFYSFAWTALVETYGKPLLLIELKLLIKLLSALTASVENLTHLEIMSILDENVAFL